MTQSECKLKIIFEKRLEFINEMKRVIPNSYPSNLPLDMSKKESQQVCRDLVLKGVEEMFEALQHLKNWKPHRQTDIPEDIDKDEFLEEIVDAFNYFFAMLIVTGFNEEDLFDAFLVKDNIIRNRLKNGY